MSNFVNAITALTALSATGAAWWGIFSWKSQKKWSESRDIGKRYLKLVFDFRTSVEALSDYTHEMLKSEDIVKISGKPVEQRPFWTRFYSRMNQLRDIKDKKALMENVRDEAIAIWGDEVEFWHKELEVLLKELEAYVYLDLAADNPDLSQGEKRYIEYKRAETRSCYSHSIPGKPMDQGSFSLEFEEKFRELRGRVTKRLN